MFGILDDLKKQVEHRRDVTTTTTTTTTHGSRSHREMPRLVLQTSSTTVDIQQYRAKCSELEELAKKFRAKCQECDGLSSRYNQLKSSLQEQRQKQQQQQQPIQQQQNKTSGTSTLVHKQGAPSLASRDPFIEFGAPEMSMKGIPAGHGTKRKSPNAQISPDNARAGSGAAEGTTPTKRPRGNTLSTALPGLLSSPLTSHKPLFSYNPRRRGQVSTTGSRPAPKGPMSSPPYARTAGRVTGAAPSASAAVARVSAAPIILPSSQETRLDFSDPPYMPEDDGELLCLGTHPEEGESEHKDEGAAAGGGGGDAWDFVLQTPARPMQQYPEWPREASDSGKENGSVSAQPTPDLQRILDAVGDCEPCRSFYSVPGLVLPRRDPSTLCQHGSGSRRSKGKAAGAPCDGPSAMPLRHYRDSMSAPRPERVATSSSRPEPIRQPPRSEQRRPTTPDHFWDIDYFPPINALGVDTFRKDKHQSSDSS
ncbi:hypothetical protein GGI09_006234 [Coemansia sp. S100]|nr:hypothetical protein GGI09_006234 [Coemansia sp. S100]